jgi:hypothetical protein
MGQDASGYFNALLARYHMNFIHFMKRLGMEMWGDRIGYYYMIPKNDRGKPFRRQYLESKDPSGVDCVKSKPILKKCFFVKNNVKDCLFF